MNINYDSIAQTKCQTLSYERASIERCKTVFPGKTIFDLGFCDGLWTYAAFQAGAKKVIAFDISMPDRFKRFLEYGDRFEGVIGRVGNGVDHLPSLSLDAWINEHKIEPDFIKMDVEGHEIYALNGMQTTIKRCKPDMMIEVHGGAEAKNTIVQMLKEWTEREPSGENWILNHIYHLYYLPPDI